MKNKKGTVIREVLKGSIAEEAGIQPGDCILEINGERIKDIFDYRFLITDENVNMVIRKENGDIWDIDIEKDTYEDMGIEFEDPMIDSAKSCANKCIFCFIDQLPKGMRETLYFKDDDTRLSFLTGNYVTLTNISDKELDRIIKYHMSPINISVHSTNPSVRKLMLGNRFAGNILERIKKLVNAGITVNCQIVLCRGINDQEELDRTIKDLSDLYPGVGSISVVPVGITKYREGLYPLVPYDGEESKKVLEQVEGWQKKLLEEKGSRVVYAADEFYIMAEKELPGYEEYEGFPQLENGVGMVALFKEEFFEYLEDEEAGLNEKGVNADEKAVKDRIVSVATGISAYKIIKKLAEELENRYNNLKINVYPVENRFFGKYVTVAGLLTGQDIVYGLKDKELGQVLLIPKNMLKSDEDVFLDDYTVEKVGTLLNVKVKVLEVNGKAFVDGILGKI
mgnify:CR=1 FL=1